ncbi:hypothetical protein [Enterococcus alishanensis]
MNEIDIPASINEETYTSNLSVDQPLKVQYEQELDIKNHGYGHLI